MVSQVSDDIVIKKLHVGALRVPRWLGNFFMRSIYHRLQDSEKYRVFTEVIQAIKDFRLQQSRMLLVYQWRPDMMSQIQTQSQVLLLSEADQKRLQVYNKHLVEISRTVNGQSISLTRFLKPLFSIAQERTYFGSDPVAENQIALLTLAIYVNKKTVRELLNSDDVLAYPRPRQINVSLLNRHDLAQHFLTSTAIAASTDTSVADALGLFKELDDSQGGSGFSFADLAADRAGVRFAEIATRSPDQARLLQRRISEIKRETDFMPRIDQLPEGIMALEFEQRYGDLDSAAYRMVNNEIGRRIAACWIYH